MKLKFKKQEYQTEPETEPPINIGDNHLPELGDWVGLIYGELVTLDQMDSKWV